MPSNWDVTITTPRGHNGHTVIDATASDEEIVEQLTRFVQHMREADVEPIAGTPGLPPATQPSRKP